MGGKMSRNKGQRVEREAAALLQEVIDRVHFQFGEASPSLKRNLMQTMEGGHDLIGLEWLALEVKHQENQCASAKASWWTQTCDQALTSHGEPVLMYRKNRTPWRVVIAADVRCLEEVIKMPIDISLESFLEWFEYRLVQEVKKKAGL